MAYGAPTDTGQHQYSLTFTHTPTGLSFGCSMIDTGSSATDSAKDQVFQAFLNAVMTLPNVVVNGATKSGAYTITVTSP